MLGTRAKGVGIKSSNYLSSTMSREALLAAAVWTLMWSWLIFKREKRPNIRPNKDTVKIGFEAPAIRLPRPWS